MNNYEKVADWIVYESSDAFDEVLFLLKQVCDEDDLGNFYSEIILSYNDRMIKTPQKPKQKRSKLIQ